MNHSLVDQIKIRDLTIVTTIGVPDAEREVPQRLSVDLNLVPMRPWTDGEDRIASTIDYSEVAVRIRRLAANQECRLIETLADKIAEMVLTDFPVKTITLELKKWILPDCGAVSVVIQRDRRT